MNNGKSKAGESDMRRLVALLLLAVFCVVLFAPTAGTVSWTPETWSVPHQEAPITKPEYDDYGWNDESSSPTWNRPSLLGCCDIRVTAPTLFLWFFDLLDTPESPNQGNGNDHQSLDHDRRTSPQ